MADQSPEQANNKKKRRLRSAPTLREQTEQKQSKQAEKKPSRIKPLVKKFFGSKLFEPFRILDRLLRSFWQSGPLRPVRVVARVIGLILVPPYFRNSWKELRQVVWPNLKTTWKLTFAVLVFGTIFGLAIYGLDIVLEKALREVLLG